MPIWQTCERDDLESLWKVNQIHQLRRWMFHDVSSAVPVAITFKGPFGQRFLDPSKFRYRYNRSSGADDIVSKSSQSIMDTCKTSIFNFKGHTLWTRTLPTDWIVPVSHGKPSLQVKLIMTVCMRLRKRTVCTEQRIMLNGFWIWTWMNMSPSEIQQSFQAPKSIMSLYWTCVRFEIE